MAKTKTAKVAEDQRVAQHRAKKQAQWAAARAKASGRPKDEAPRGGSPMQLAIKERQRRDRLLAETAAKAENYHKQLDEKGYLYLDEKIVDTMTLRALKDRLRGNRRYEWEHSERQVGPVDLPRETIRVVRFGIVRD